MNINSSINITTNNIGLNSKHFDIGFTPKKLENTNSFASIITSAIEKVNDLEIQSESLQQKMVTDPDSVNLHEVTVAQTEAELALSFTKSISTRVITAFNELTNLR